MKLGAILKLNAISFILLLVVSLFAHFCLVKATPGTIYIRADGSVDPPTAPISSTDNITYTFTSNIYESEIVVERNDIVLDGAGFFIGAIPLSWDIGIDLSSRNNVTIKNMEINGFERGIQLHESSDNTIYDVTIYGIGVETQGCVGIWIESSSNNNISSNVIADYYWECDANGTVLIHSSDNRICGNYITDNYFGIFIFDSSNNTLSGNYITENQYDGIRLEYSLDNSISGNDITANYENGIHLIYSSNYNDISGNNITNNDEGIGIRDGSNYNDISGNNITNNMNGVYIGAGANNNTISENNITKNYGYSQGGGIVVNGDSNIVSGNNITNNRGQFGWPEDWHGISIASNNNTISGNNITHNGVGIKIGGYSYNVIFMNDIARNERGIGLGSSSNNLFLLNNITANNYEGIGLWGSSDNQFCLNNFVCNSDHVRAWYGGPNVWDNYPNVPRLGNYWSDYAGEDQNGDNIGDTPYVIDENNTDTYPLMNPYLTPPPQPTEYNLTITTNEGGTTDPPPGTHIYCEGNVVRVYATDYAPYFLYYWMLDDIEIPAGPFNWVDVTMDCDHTLEAVFISPEPAGRSIPRNSPK